MAEVPVAAGVTPVQATFSAMSLPANASGIAMVSGNEQSGTVNTELAAPLVVQVSDASGNAIPGLIIDWTAAGGGSVSAASTVTGPDGRTSVTRTLGGTAGQQTTLATAAGLAGSPVAFTHTATAGNAARIIVVDGNGQSAPAGTKLDKELVVRLLDAENNPIAGRPVSWVVGTGGGSASPETSATDGNGQAKTEWTLGPTPGPNTLTAVVSGVGNGSFNATGTKLESNTRITSHQPEPAIVGAPVTVGVTVEGEGGPPSGQVTVAGDGAPASCTITLSNGSGSCQITFAQPGNRDVTATYAGDTRFSGSSNTAKHQVGPAPNAAPVTQTDTYGMDEDVVLVVSAAEGVLKNDSDPEGSALTAVNPSEPTNGQVSLNSDGSFTYTPDENFSGNDQFTYGARDGGGSTTTATVTIQVTPVNDQPTASDDAYPTPGAGAALIVTAPGVLANDSDPDGPLTAAKTSDPLQGTLSLNPDGSFTYTPNIGAAGSDSFTYEASDGSLTSQATVAITINP
jgi:VCBS repeat-containing protein